MDIHSIYEIEPMVFPTNRSTRVMVGERGVVKEGKFSEGLVTIQPGGSIPTHDHGTVEVYTILSGNGIIIVDDEKMPIKKGDFIRISPWQKHSLVNTGDETMSMLFVYSPGVAVDHWDKELKGDNLL